MMRSRSKYLIPAVVAVLILLLTLPVFFGRSRPAPDRRHGVVSANASGGLLFHTPHGPDASLAPGKFLVADRRIRGAFFSQSVILLVSYGENGAMGMVINRPTNVALSSVLPNLKGMRGRRDKVFLGGPVGLGEMFLLIRSGSEPQASVHVFGNVYMSMSRKTLEGLIARHQGEQDFRIYAGYAGWAAGQLETEVARGDWHVMDAESGIVFDRKSEDIWPELINRASAQWVEAFDSPAHFL
jgi:putative transcriptional regulator